LLSWNTPALLLRHIPTLLSWHIATLLLRNVPAHRSLGSSVALASRGPEASSSSRGSSVGWLRGLTDSLESGLALLLLDCAALLLVDRLALLLVDSPALVLILSLADLFVAGLHHRVAALFVDCVTDLLIDHLALLLGDRLRHRLTLLLLLGPAVFLVHNVAPLVDHSVTILCSGSGANLVDNIGAFLFHALGALLLVDDIQDLGADFLRHIPTDFLKCGCAALVCDSLALFLLHDVTGRVADSGTLPLTTAGAGLLVDCVHNLVTFLLLVWTAGLAETDTAPSVLDSLALLLVVHLADLVIDGVAVLVLHRLAHVLVHGLAGGAGSHVDHLGHGGTVVVGGRHRHRGSVAGDLSSDGGSVLVGGHQSDARRRLAGRRH